MLNCFSLTRKSDIGAGPVSFQVIDEEMCKFFNQPCDPVKYMDEWYDIIGFNLAMDLSFDKQRVKYIEKSKQGNELGEFCKNLVKIIDWLDENFTYDAWAEIGCNN